MPRRSPSIGTSTLVSRRRPHLAALLALLLAPLLGAGTACAERREKAAPRPAPPTLDETLAFAPFGTLHLLRPAGEPRHVLLFVSGDGGWTSRTLAMARGMAGTDALLIGVDVESYRRHAAKSREECVYAASDFEGLSKYVQLKLGLPRYQPPALVGYSSGASLAYGVLAQAPPSTFRGALSLGFCPSLEFPRPLCKGSGYAAHAGAQSGDLIDWIFEPVSHLSQDWLAFTGDQDQICTARGVRDFIRQVPHGIYQEIPGAGHGYTDVGRWVPSFRAALSRLERDARLAAPRASAPAVADLPLVEVPSRGPAGDPRFAVILSGDGGWAGLDREVAGVLAARGIPVVGWNTLDYFWHARTPDGGGRDLARVLDHYRTTWKRDRVLLIGYSLGADVLPFFARRLPPEALAHVDLIALLGPSRETSFEFHLSDWLGGSSGAQHPVLPEVRALAGHPLLCLYGEKEDDSLCPQVQPPLGTSVALRGAHHFGGSYQTVADRILGALPAAR